MDQTILEVNQSDSKVYTIIIQDEDGVAIDITGDTILFTVKENLGKSDELAIIKKTITTHTNPTAGETEITLTSTDTNHIGTYIFGIVRQTSLNVRTTIIEGIMIFKQSVSIRDS